MKVISHQDTNSIGFGGAELRYRDLGNPAGPAVLLLHGGFGTLEDFEGIVSPLLPGFRVLAMDARGQGQSTLGDLPLTYRQMQLDAEELLVTLGISSASLVGFSDGGMTAWLMALSGKIVINKLIAIGAPWRQQDLEATASLLEKITPASWKEKFSESYELYHRLNPTLDFPRLVAALKSMWLDKSATGGYPGNELFAITCPLLFIRGDEDHLVSLETVAALKAGLPDAKFLNIPYAGHDVMGDEPGIAAAFIHRFLAG